MVVTDIVTLMRCVVIPEQRIPVGGHVLKAVLHTVGVFVAVRDGLGDQLVPTAVGFDAFIVE